MATGGPRYERRRSKRGGGLAASTARALPLAGRLWGLRRSSVAQRAPPTPTAAHRSFGDRHRVYRHQWPFRPHWRDTATRMGVGGTYTRSVSGMPAGTATADGGRGPFARNRFKCTQTEKKVMARWRATYLPSVYGSPSHRGATHKQTGWQNKPSASCQEWQGGFSQPIQGTCRLACGRTPWCGPPSDCRTPSCPRLVPKFSLVTPRRPRSASSQGAQSRRSTFTSQPAPQARHTSAC